MRAATLLTPLTLTALIAGAIYGQYQLFDPANPIDRSHWTFIAGDLVLIRPLMLLVVPLAFACAVAAARTARMSSRFSLAMGATLVYFAVTMLVAAMLGTAAAVFLRPGQIPAEMQQPLIARAAEQFQAAGDLSHNVQAIIDTGQNNLANAWLVILHRALPDNLAGDLTAGRLLGVIVLGLLVGLGIAAGGERTRVAGGFFDALSTALRHVVRWITWLAPVGIFLLVANAVGSTGFSVLRGALERYTVTVIGSLAAHAFVVLPVTLLVFARCNPLAYLWSIGRALCVAFATASSTATLPVSMEAAVGRPDRRDEPGRAEARSAPCSRSAANLVLPLAAMLSMNGTALFQAAAAVFLCQLYGVPLSMNELVVIVITATVAAISTTGIPSAGLITLIIVITAVNTSLGGREQLPAASAIGMLVAVDRLLDMCRTTVNVWSDLVGARIITAIAPDDVSATIV